MVPPAPARGGRATRVEDGRPIGMVSVREALHTDFTELIELIDTRDADRE